MRPAPTSRTTASAISTITSACRKRCRPPPLDAPCAPSLSESVRSTRSARTAGARLKARLVKTATAAVKSSTRRSTVTSATRGMLAGFHQPTNLTPAKASARPTAVAMPVRTRLSVSSCRITRNPLAPSAARTAISRWRPSARARRRFATFAQAMSRRNATAPKSSQMARRTEPTTSSVSDNTTVSNCICFGYKPSLVIATAMPCSSSAACSTVAPGFRRPTA